MNESITKIKERAEEEACRICKKDPMAKEDVMLLGQLIDVLKDISTIETMGGYGDKYLDMDEYSMRRGRSPYTGRYTSMAYKQDTYSNARGGGNMYPMPSYNSMAQGGGQSNGYNGYSGHSINDRMIDALERMLDTAATEHERMEIMKRIDEIRRSK